ncbi:MAG: ATP-binding cassette domain-containing protein, partial [Clostridia bacterium]
KPINYIFGKNGSGKTAILNFINNSLNNEYEIFLFNEKYIYQNIYTNELSKDTNSIECLSSNESKKNTYEIFFGKKLKDIMDEINDLNKKLSIVKEEVLNTSKLTSVLIHFSEFIVEK